MFRFRSAHVVRTLAAAACLTGPAGAQPCQNDFDCDGSMPEGGWSLGQTTGARAPFVPDRRPVYRFSLFCGEACRSCDGQPNPTGLNPYWNEADWPKVEQRLNEFFDAGFRRIVLDRPGGNLPNNWKVPQSHYHYLSDAQKSMIQNELAEWIRCKRTGCDGGTPAPDLQVGVFIGSFQYDLCSPCLDPEGGVSDGGTPDDPSDDVTWWDCPPDASLRFMNPDDPKSLADIYGAVAPWAEAGIDAVWFDNASRWDANYDQSPEALMRLLERPEFDSLTLGGEAVPWYRENRIKYLDMHYAERAPWFGEYWWFLRRGWVGPRADLRTDVDPATTEIGIAFGETATRLDNDSDSEFVHGIRMFADVRDAGYLVWATHRSVIPMVQRLYDGEHNELYEALMTAGNPADFDGNGAVNCNDYMLFLRRWSGAGGLGHGAADPAFWDGDIDGDDAVTSMDFMAFLTLADWGACVGR